MQPFRSIYHRIIVLLALVALLAACTPIQAPAATEIPKEEAETTPVRDTATTSSFPVTVENCGIETTYTEAPTRAVTMNQAATEIMLALGLEGSMVGTAYLDDDAVLPQWQDAYATVPVIADEYPSQEVLFEAEPDFVYGSYRSAFGEEAAGPREQLAELGINSYLSVASCEDAALRPEKVTFQTLFDEILNIGRIFGVEERAQTVVDEMQATLDGVLATIGDAEPVTVFWYDSEADAPYVGTCCGAPAMLLEAVGAQNIFADTPGTWANVTWEEVIARNPEVIVLADAEWSTAQEKIDLLLSDSAYSSIEAVQNQRFVSIPFGATTLGVRNVEGVVTLAQRLYPEKFE
jgi:iron complex transport system substrate-binding protein